MKLPNQLFAGKHMDNLLNTCTIKFRHDDNDVDNDVDDDDDDDVQYASQKEYRVDEVENDDNQK